jgi:hypothetical protein
VDKVLYITNLAEQSGFPSGPASKLYGVANFLETGMFGRVGRAGLEPIKNRQYEGGFIVTPEIRASFELLRDLMKMQPRREFSLFRRTIRRILVASDASYEGGAGKAGVLLVRDPGCPEETRMGRVIIIPEAIYSFWGTQKTYIAQLELLAVLVAMVEFAAVIRECRGLWFVDNVAALMSLVKGCSGSASLDQMAKVIHMGNFALKAVPYFEYVESKANWSDEISRIGLDGAWAQEKGFVLDTCSFWYQMLALPCAAVAAIFEFL